MLKENLNRIELSDVSPLSGVSQVAELLLSRLRKNSSRNLIVAFDGYLGTDWSQLNELKDELGKFDVEVDLVDCSSFWRKPRFIWNIIKSYLECDEHFGRIYPGSIEDFLDADYIKDWLDSLEKSRRKKNRITVLYGNGVVNKLTNRFFDEVFYVDITRAEFLKKVEQNSHRFIPEHHQTRAGQADVGMSLITFKLSQYICSPIFDKHRRSLLKKMSYYILLEDDIKALSRKDLVKISDSLSSQPFILEPLYIPGPWGGQWIKSQRKLDQSYLNCAWAFEAVTGDMHLPVLVNRRFLFRLPFQTFLALSRRKIMGEKLCKRFGFFFPVRVHYDDSYDGGNMAIQVHPNKAYVMKHFGEKVGQHEAYYIVVKKERAGVYLGLKEGIDVNELKMQVSRSHLNKVPFDYENYINFIESKVGDLFLIPAGTVHALGKDQVCLEIGTSYGYTFHLYDYLRPDLRGNLREIHIEHAFAALKEYRRERWVRKNLVQEPRLIRVQGNSREYLLGRRRGMIFEVRRLELEPGKWLDKTDGTFHVLTLLEGETIELHPVSNSSKPFVLKHTRTVIVPEAVGEYVIVTTRPCRILKVMVTQTNRLDQ